MSRQLDWLLQDVRFSLRTRIRNLSSTAIIALTLAVGLTCNAVAFSLTHTLLIRPYPFRQLERLVLLREGRAADQTLSIRLTAADLNDVRRETSLFDDFARYRFVSMSLTGPSEPVRLRSFAVSPNLFEMLGVQALQGRTLTAADGAAGSRVAVLSHGVWQSQFGGNQAVIGMEIALDGKTHTVVGVMPSAFNFPRGADVWLPLVLSAEDERERVRSTLSAVARLRPEATLLNARAELDRYASTLAQRYPLTNAERRLEILPLREEQYEYTLPFFSMLEVAALFVLLVAGINAGNIFLTERAARHCEQAMRFTLGATRGQLVVNGLVDAVLLAALGALVAIPFTWRAVRAIREAMPSGIAIFVAGWNTLEVDASVLSFSIATTVVVALVLGWMATFSIPTAALVGSAERQITSRASRFSRRAVIAQLVAALVLLSGAVSIFSGFWRLARAFQALEPDGVLIAGIALPAGRYPDPSSQAAFFGRAMDAVQRIASVEGVALVSNLPASNVPNARTSFAIEHRLPTSPAEMLNADVQAVGGALFPLLRVHLLKGRHLRESDNAESAPVVVISDTMARRHWPGEEPLGKRIRLGSWGETGPWWTIVGVVADVKQNWFDPTPRPIVYVPLGQRPVRSVTLLVRSGGDPHFLARPVRDAVKQLDPSQSLSEIATLRNEIDDSVAPIRIIGTVLAIFAMVTLAIATVGVYAIVAGVVARRTKEVGVRMALGARPSAIILTLLTDTLRFSVWGVILGLSVSVWLHTIVGSRLYNLVSVSPIRLAGLSVFLFGITLLASYFPARRALSVDPAVALRTL